MSALEGVWNEQLWSEHAFVTAVRNIVKAGLTAALAIQREQPQAVFINSESSELFQACCPEKEIVAAADFENERRFIALDLLYGVRPSDRIREYLTSHGLSGDEFECFMRTG